MDKEKIMMAMDHIDAAFIAEAADGGKNVKKSSWKKVAVIAACLCMALATSVVAVAKSGVLLQFFVGNEWKETLHWIGERDAGGYMASGTVVVPVEKLSEEVRALAVGKEDTSVSLGYSSFFGRNAWSDMEDFIGLEVADNPLLDGAVKGLTTYINEDGSETEGHGILRLNIQLQEICQMWLSSWYEFEGHYDRIHVGVDAQIDTVGERNDGEPIEGPFGARGQTFTEAQKKVMTVEEYTMANGKIATIIQIPRVNADGSLRKKEYTAYFQGDNAFICVTAQCWCHGVIKEQNTVEQHGQETLSTLKEVLDAFE